MTKVRVALLAGHRYGRRVAKAMLQAPDLEFVHAFLLHPRNLHRYGGFESASGVLADAGIGTTYFDEVAELRNQDSWIRARAQFILVAGLRQLVPDEMLWRVARDNRVPTIYSERTGFICFHPSNLPDGAGLAPVQWTIFEGLSEGTVTAFLIDDGAIDAGPVIAKRHFPVAADADAGDLDHVIGDETAALFLEFAPALANGSLSYTPQTNFGIQRRSRPQITNRERWIDFYEPVDRIMLQVRAFAKPYGGTAALIGDSAMMLYACERAILDRHLAIGEFYETAQGITVGCADGAICITSYEML
jgi:methionyl-tRNA formyltransferase